MKLLIGGSPCTHWSIAQTKNRETEASGIGWELFLNYRIARDKYQPDYFLYENNKSMSSAIRAQITAELGVEPVLINSALVSAQNRQRLYWAGKRNPDGTYSQVPVELPEDRGILLRDILETGFPLREKGYALLTGHDATAEDAIAHRRRNAVAEPVKIKPLSEKEMEYMVRETKDGRNHFDFDYFHDATKDKSACVTANTHKGVPYNVLAEPVRIGTIENDAKNPDHDSQQYRVYSPDGKSVTLCGNGGGIGAKTGLYAVPAAVEYNPLHSCDGVLFVFKQQKLKDDRDQAERTGWRNLRDWVLAQMAIIEAGMASVDEVFLPYLTDGHGNTLYTLYSSGMLRLGDGT